MQDYQLIEIACKVSGVSIKDIASDSRKQDFVDARWLAFSLLHKYTRLTDEEIGQLFDRDKLAVAYGINQVIKALELYKFIGITSNLTRICLKSKIETINLTNKLNHEKIRRMGKSKYQSDISGNNCHSSNNTVVVCA